MDELFSKHVKQQLSKSSPTPLYHQLHTVLKNMVIDGTLEYGARMPTEEQLADLFVVSRITAKRAMDELALEGLVERRRGKGTHVIYRYSPKPVQAPLTGMLQEIESMARNSHALVLDYGMRVPPQSIRSELHLADGETALHLLRVRERDGLKFGYYTSWPQNPKTPFFERIIIIFSSTVSFCCIFSKQLHYPIPLVRLHICGKVNIKLNIKISLW